MKRRDFVIAATTGLAAVSIPTAYYFFRDVEYDNLLAQPQSLSLILDPQAINLIGNQYRAAFPSETRAGSLVKLLETTPASGLNERITNDFKTGNTVLVDGWILSVTEARQCALASTIDPK